MKTNLAVSVSLLVVVVAIASLIPGRAQSAGTPTAHPPGNGAPPANPLKVALLKWYAANTTTSFKVGKEPYGVAFDGQNIWTANSGDGTLTKLRASDGERLGEFVCGAGYGVAFDGANIWATRIDNKVVKVRASDGKVLGIYDAGTSPFWLAFDGANIWVANFGVGTGSVTELRASDGKTLPFASRL